MSDTVKCPHCGSVADELYEYFGDGMNETSEIDCGHCGFTFQISRTISVDYDVIGPDVPVDAFWNPTKPTLADHAREWWKGQGKEMPELKSTSDKAVDMYQQWLDSEREKAVIQAKQEEADWWKKHGRKP